MSAASEMLLEAVRAMTEEERAELRALLGLHVPVSEPGELLTVERAAEHVGCHVETLRRAIRSGRLQAARVGSQWRVGPEALAEWMVAPAPARASGGRRPGRRQPRPSSVDGAWDAIRINA
jgi:excisionase family DNA binding protein